MGALVAAVAVLIWGLASRNDSSESAGGRAPAPSTSAPASPVTSSPTLTPTPRATTPRATATPSPAPTFGPSTVRPDGKPQRVVVVSGGGRVLVDATLVPDRLDADGVLAPPFGVAGWYAEPGWAKPGWPGAAILAGHINRRSPSLQLDTFGRLPQVRAGDRITVVYSSGDTVTFVATKSRALSKKAVPKDDTIWDAHNPKPILRLITCDPTTPVKGGHYEGNWVVWASLV